MDRRRPSLVLLLLFVLCTGAAIVWGGSRPALEQGLAPDLVQFLGYACALGAGLLLISSTVEGAAADPRRLGAVVLAALAVLVLLDLLADDGPDIGAGLGRLVGLVVIMVATIRLAMGVAAAGRVR
ncbi:hypothetical protein [Blastococcus haudaquaticus]|uniref:Uncharacterized protein n=1 Tax=Blastococcus haudaquaticus TaxID=1938745 RepID=A0A286GHM6_9ACTN|nr:hypothetical protein [Blastococcus haudaquaticus]SOD94619.1 hypothetical protein SAMN06272739_0929 [Blastococcus haudaquaticus]